MDSVNLTALMNFVFAFSGFRKNCDIRETKQILWNPQNLPKPRNSTKIARFANQTKTTRSTKYTRKIHKIPKKLRDSRNQTKTAKFIKYTKKHEIKQKSRDSQIKQKLRNSWNISKSRFQTKITWSAKSKNRDLQKLRNSWNLKKKIFWNR